MKKKKIMYTTPLITEHMFGLQEQERIIYNINSEFLKFGIHNFLFKRQL